MSTYVGQHEGIQSNIDSGRMPTSQEADTGSSESFERGYTENGLSQPLKRTLVPGCEQNSEQTNAVYEEWAVQGYIKRVRIGKKNCYSLDFRVDDDFADSLAVALTRAEPDTISSSSYPCASCSLSSSAHLDTEKSVPWTPEEVKKIIYMKEKQHSSWKDIAKAVPQHSQASIQEHYSTKLKTKTSLSRSGRKLRNRRRT